MSPLEQHHRPARTAGVRIVSPAVERYPQLIMWTAAVELAGRRVGWVFFTRDRQSHLRRWGARDTRGRRLPIVRHDGWPVRGRDAIAAILDNARWDR